MSFLETPRFPTDISYGSSGGPTYNTLIASLESGQEKRNIIWTQARHQYDVAYGVRDITQLNALLAFFHAVRGRAHGFRYKDFSDYQSTAPQGTPTSVDQVIGTGDDSDTTWQMFKSYAAGALSLARPITKPVSGTILVAVNAVTQTESVDYTIDHTTGIITFVNPPTAGHTISWGGEFDVPVRFDTDMLETTLSHFLHGSTQVPLIEVRVGA